MKRALVLALLVALSGCSMLGSPGDTGTEGPDPSKDELGWEDGYWYDDPVEVDASDGLSEQELNAVVARSMARIERLRGLEFNKSVPVEIISRSEYREDQPFEVNGTEARWNNQVWEGLLLVGEDRNISAVFEQAYGSAVLGYYSPEDDRIVIVSDSEEPTIDRGTLVHELATRSRTSSSVSRGRRARRTHSWPATASSRVRLTSSSDATSSGVRTTGLVSRPRRPSAVAATSIAAC